MISSTCCAISLYIALTEGTSVSKAHAFSCPTRLWAPATASSILVLVVILSLLGFSVPPGKKKTPTGIVPAGAAVRWRRERDSNPRGAYHPYTISSRACSARLQHLSVFTDN